MKYYTGETIKDVTEYLDKHKIKYNVYSEKTGMLAITDPWGVDYNYWATTGRWFRADKYAWRKKAYYSKGIEQFVTKFLNKY